MELLLLEYKAALLTIPGWLPGRDTVVTSGLSTCVGSTMCMCCVPVCVSQFKLGLVAASCLAPGISTLLANLLTNPGLPAARRLSLHNILNTSIIPVWTAKSMI